MKIYWRVGEKPTGPYRSFQTRSWPTAYYEDGKVAFQIYPAVPKTSYDPSIKETEILIVSVADYVGNVFTWRRLKARPFGLTQAKKLAQEFVDQWGDTLRNRNIAIVDVIS